jgi:lipopolysaccharide biosynthesis protein
MFLKPKNNNKIHKMNHKKIGVILHLYYVDLWNYFLPYLKNIDTDIDLYVTITDGHSGFFTDIHDLIMTDFPQSYIYSLPNRGMDIAPFIYVMNEISLSKKTYDVIIKLHSKKSLAHSYELGERWRNQLTNALLGSLSKLQNNYLSCVNSNSKMIGSSVWVLNEKVSFFEQQFFSEEINFTNYEFVGGTMFMVDFNLIMDWFVEQDIYKRFYNQFEDGYIGDGSIAHKIERVLGCLVKVKGNQILKT